jgi:calcineurin-like phosphoesterase family protein
MSPNKDTDKDPKTNRKSNLKDEETLTHTTLTQNLIWGWEIPKDIPRQSGRKKLYLTSDEHYHHRKIIGYQNRPFATLEEMNNTLVANHNAIVKENDTVIHIGDFSFGKKEDFLSTALKLNGVHFFMDGSHDLSLRAFFVAAQADHYKQSWEGKIKLLPKLFEFTFNGEKIVLCHYALKKWWASHHGSLHFYGHSHGNDPDPIANSRDIGVDTTNFFPILIEDAIASVKNEKKD